MATVFAIWSRKSFINFGSLNTAYITLILKKDGVVHVKDFSPISVVHSFTKLVTKLMENRIASRLNKMVSPNQSAFIKCRFVQDNFMLVHADNMFPPSAKLVMHPSQTRYFEGLWLFILAISHWGHATAIFWPSLKGYPVVCSIHSDLVKWDSRWTYLPSVWLTTRRPFVTYAFYSGYGRHELHVVQIGEWGVATTTLDKGPSSSDLHVCRWCGIIPMFRWGWY